MKVFLVMVFLLMSGLVAFAGEESIEINWNVQPGDYSFHETQDGSYYLKVKNCYCMNSPGNPALPVKVYRIILPPDANLKSVKVCLAETAGDRLDGTHSITPANPYYVGEDGPFWGENEPDVVDGKNRAIYDSDKAYPYAAVRVHDTGQMRKWKFARIHFTPVRYMPKSGKLELIKSARIKITYDRGNQHAISTALLNDSVFDEIAERTFDNYDAAEQWYRIPVAPMSYAMSSYAGERGYAIITTPGVAGNGCLNAFIAHKESLGFTVYVVTSDHKNWLKSNYASKHIVYGLILAHPSTISPGDADLGYTDLTGDRAPELFTGRFEEDDQKQHRTDEDWMIVPVGIDAITEYLQRVIAYDTATDVDYRKKALFSNGFLPDFVDLVVAGFTRAGGFSITSGGAGSISDKWKAEPFGLIQQRSHGMTHSIKTHFYKKDCSEIPWTDKPAVVHIIACHCGEYTAHTAGSWNSISLCMLKSCAIAVMANDASATGWPSWDGPERGYVENLGWFFHKQIEIHGATVGEAHCLSKFYATDFAQPDYANFNLKGEPSVRIQVGDKLQVIAKRPLEYAKPGRTYKEMLGAIGGEKPYSWTLEEGDLPAGIELLEDGMLIGTPSSSGGYPFKVKVTDATGLAVDVAWLQIDVGDSGIVDNSPLPDAMVDDYYAYVLTTQQGTSTMAFTWSWTGNMPPGLDLGDRAGIISGTPTTPGIYTFTAKVKSASKDFTITVLDPNDLRVTTECLYNAELDYPYSQTLAASGGTESYTWSIVTGDLPQGLTLDSGSGVISGTPTLAGKCVFTVEVADGSSTAQKELYIEVIDTGAPPTLQITTTSLPDGAISLPYSASLTAQGGTTPYTWSITSGSLPTGISLSAGGDFTGTPTVSGDFSFTVKVTDGVAATATKDLSIHVSVDPPPIEITTGSPMPKGAVNVAYSATLEATGGVPPYDWIVISGSLPAGVDLSHSGVFSGTPTTEGVSTFTVQVDSISTDVDTKEFVIEILPADSLVITSSSLPAGELGAAYSTTIKASGGTPPNTWSVSSGLLPPGLNLDAATGAISGTAAATGTYNFTAHVDDAVAAFATRLFSIAINPAGSPAPPMYFKKKKKGGCALSADSSDASSASGALIPYILLLALLAVAGMRERKRRRGLSKCSYK